MINRKWHRQSADSFTLLIGGSFDGERVQVVDDECLRLVLRKRNPIVNYFDPTEKVEEEIYVPMKLCGANEPKNGKAWRYFKVFHLEGMSGGDVMAKLIENYGGERGD